MILVSSCLAGLEVRYDGHHSLNENVRKLVKENNAVTICPELLGGFLTPREPAEIVGGDGGDVLDGKARVIERSGRDVTELYIKGAYNTLDKAIEIGVTIVVLKENSPSCGSSMIYNGEFTGKRVWGNGVTAALLKRNGLRVISEKQFAEDSF
ncbi:DUF523 domain-containing protein [Alkalihalobacillus macyae]|uniref:DUF523 domain-containing protein n=1 Tax=Guptibacillus hwajinpoensis TaxID=208199 RepID=UPI00273C0A4D|nr:DUF523 domain-containing protein [Alkalihalobacillus macyae]MDP4553500.1 DUF523 domain-containing protein [Alkalihalobacillus macyae]